MADDYNPEEPSAHQRLCWWRDPEYYDMDGFPKERAADPEARCRYERAQAERQFRGNLDLLDGVPRSRHELLIAGSLENYITAFLHHALSAFGDSLLDKRISGTEAIREFEQHANELLTETFNHKWLFALRRFELTEDESSEKQFWVVQKEAVENTRREFEELLWKAELEEAASPIAPDGAGDGDGEAEIQLVAQPGEQESTGQPGISTGLEQPVFAAAIDGNLIPQFPKRASWLKDRLRERSWNKHDLSRQRGPNHKTVQKVLDGFAVREDVLQKVADALSKRHGQVSVLDIPQD